MSKEEAMEILEFHGDFSRKNSFLYYVKEESLVNENIFHEIMKCVITLAKSGINIQEVACIYSIIFWCRSWLDSGVMEKRMELRSRDLLRIYIEIIENALYYLLHGNEDEAFWVYSEFLDGRYE